MFTWTICSPSLRPEIVTDEEVGSRVETRRATLPFLTDSSRAHPAGSHWSAELIEGLS